MGALLHDALETGAARFGERPFVRAGDDAWSFAELNAWSNVVARWLVEQGVQPRQRVAVTMSNRVEFVVTVNAISKAGAAAVLISPAWKAAEVAHAVDLTEPVLHVTDDTDLPGSGRFSGHEPVNRPEPDDEAVLVFSSGTTGLPKAVRHTHRSIGHGTRHWVASLGLGPDDRFQVATPPSHILGLLNLLAAATAGATVRLHARFDLDEVLRRIGSDRITLEMAVAPIALAMANHPTLEAFDLSSLRYIMWGATPVTPAVAERVTERTGVRWLPAYGASELPVIACNPVHEPDRWRLDSAGLPPDGVELRVGDDGEIQVRSESVMAGYLPDEANADAFTADGWYRTGDIGWLEPEGWVHLTDRSKEMIKVKGFQVAPAEIEAVLLGHPAVVDCAVFGVPDEAAGEAPVAAVQLADGAHLDEGELERLVADSLATYKQLRHVVVVDTIPRLPSGKALRRVLREELSWT